MAVSAVFAVGIGASSLVFLGVFSDIRANEAVYEAVRGRLVVLAALWGVLLVGALWALRDFFGRLSRAIGSVQGESQRLTDAVAAGRLDVRAEPSAVVPEFRGVVVQVRREDRVAHIRGGGPESSAAPDDAGGRARVDPECEPEA